ncbi:MAG: CDP-alcohol phosphatidyltransferase family protein [Gemmatimonadetes bacterium]|nr:CDP-alcohol phosphatidyltransferase family protein [Gemmatimonadota bacterium]
MIAAGTLSALPNALSALRVALVPVLLLSLRRDAETGGGAGASWLSGAILIGAAATDFLDGYCARRLGFVSRTGKILDPLADKIAVGGIGLALVVWFGFPVWLIALQLVRDAAIVAVGVYLFRTRGLVLFPSPLGKGATAAMVLALACYVFGAPPGLALAAVATAAALLLASSIDYLRRVLRIQSR